MIGPGNDKGEEGIKKQTEAPPKRKRGERAGIDLNNIIEAAIKVVSRDGLKFQFKDVAEELGVTRGAIHPHFRTAEKLRREVAVEVLLAMSPPRRPAETAVAHLKTLVRRCAEFTENYPRLAELAGMELVVDPWIYPETHSDLVRGHRRDRRPGRTASRRHELRAGRDRRPLDWNKQAALASDPLNVANQRVKLGQGSSAYGFLNPTDLDGLEGQRCGDGEVRRFCTQGSR